MQPHLTDISRVIQLAVAPVFLLTAVGTLINALNTRLGRIVDRRRVVEARLQAGIEPAPDVLDERRMLDRRATLAYYAVLCAVMSALLVCCVVAGAFIGYLLVVDLARVVAGLFVIAMMAMILSLSLLLREVYLAVRAGNHRRG